MIGRLSMTTAWMPKYVQGGRSFDRSRINHSSFSEKNHASTGTSPVTFVLRLVNVVLDKMCEAVSRLPYDTDGGRFTKERLLISDAQVYDVGTLPSS